MTEETSLKDEIKKNNELISKLLESGKVKGVKLKGTPSKGQVKKGYVYVLYIRENGVLDPMKVPVDELTTSIEGSPRFVTPDYLMSYKGLPAIIQPAWSIEPFNPRVNYDEATRLKTISAGRRLIINRLESGELKGKKKMAGWIIFAIIAAVLVGGYFLLS